MIDSAVFIGAIIIAITQAIKYLAPAVRGIVTMVVAVVVGIVTALISSGIGLTHTSVAAGILIALASVGVHTTASAVNTSPSVVNPNVGNKV
jgi:hypothetical protein